MAYPVPATPAGVDEAAWLSTVADVRAFCGWHIAPEVSETLTVDGSGGPIQVLPTLRIVDLTSITDDGSEVTDPEWSTSGMVRRRYAYWTDRFRGVVATLTHGFEEWPPELLSVMTELAGASASLAGVKTVASGSHQVTFEQSMRPQQRDVIGRYQLPFTP